MGPISVRYGLRITGCLVKVRIDFFKKSFIHLTKKESKRANVYRKRKLWFFFGLALSLMIERTSLVLLLYMYAGQEKTKEK